MMDWYDALNRGYAYRGISNIQGDGVSGTLACQLLNPTARLGTGPNSPVTGYIRSITVWSMANVFCTISFYTVAQLPTGFGTALNLMGEDFPTTPNAQSRFLLQAGTNPAGGSINLAQFLLNGNTIIYDQDGWFFRLQPSDPPNGINFSSIIVSFNVTTGVAIPAGQFMGVTFEWIELPLRLESLGAL
jgi:hypothetical protein